MAQLSVGALIWISVRPLISRLWLSGAFGFIITKADIFPIAASRGAGQIVLNVTLPCLMFSKIVPAFTPQNIDNLGVLVAVAFLYEAIGLFLAWSTKWFFWVPHRFRYGILCAGTISNYSDIPTAVITSITSNIPFNADTDQTISVAYVAGFILVFFISLFPMGAYKLVEMDYVGPNVEDDDLRMSPIAKTKQSLDNATGFLRKLPLPGRKSQGISQDPEKQIIAKEGSGTEASINPQPDALETLGEKVDNERHVTFSAGDSTAAPTEAGPSRGESPQGSRPNSPTKLSAPSKPPLRSRVLQVSKTAARSFLLPCSVTIVFSIVISVVTPLKALFTTVANSPIPNAPDNQPPLAFILDCATFVGAASVPLGLICLGSAVARVQLPRRGEWKNLPLGAIAYFALTKMVLLPILGVLIVQGLVHVGFIDASDKVLRFVCMFISCVPTATSQVYLTQVYSGTGEAGPLPLFLVPQYILMFLTMTILNAYSLSILF